MNDFESRVLPVVTHFATRRLKDEQSVQDAVGNAYYLYQQAPDRLALPARSFAWYGINWVLSGRDIPGTGRSGRRTDALDRPDTWRSGDMWGVRDREPGPERVALERETLERLHAHLTAGQAAYLAALQEGLNGKAIAARLGLSEGRVSQIRGELMRQVKG